MASINLLSMCVWSQARFLWFEPIYSAGCLPQFKSFWLKNSEYRIQRLKHWRTSFCPSELFRNSHFIVAQFFKKKKKVWLNGGCFIALRFVWDSAGLPVHLQFRAALRCSRSRCNNEGVGWQERESSLFKYRYRNTHTSCSSFRRKNKTNWEMN